MVAHSVRSTRTGLTQRDKHHLQEAELRQALKTARKCCLPFSAQARQGSPRLVDSLSLSGHVKSSGELGSVMI
jgi:hypothetical protein